MWLATINSLLMRREDEWVIIESSERKRAEEEIKRRNEELSVLNAFTTEVSNSLKLQEIPNRALDRVLEEEQIK